MVNKVGESIEGKPLFFLFDRLETHDSNDET